MTRFYLFERTNEFDENGLRIIRRQTSAQVHAMLEAGYKNRVWRDEIGFYIDIDDDAEAALFKLSFL